MIFKKFFIVARDNIFSILGKFGFINIHFTLVSSSKNSLWFIIMHHNDFSSSSIVTFLIFRTAGIQHFYLFGSS